MENAAKKPIALWRILIITIPFGVLVLCWLFYFVTWNISGLRDILYICGMALIVSSAALVLALIPIIFIRPLSGSEEIQVLRALGRSLLYFAIAVPAISFQCYWGIMGFWGPVV